MKPIGLIGGLTYVSTIDYYRYLNELANEKLGGSDTVEIIMHSVNFGTIKKLTEADDWKELAVQMRKAATELETAGAGCLLIGANTMHKIADEVQAAIKIPVIHIAEAVAKDILKHRLKKVGLLGTKYTMQLPFYSDRLAKHEIETIIPEQDDVEYINYTIYMASAIAEAVKMYRLDDAADSLLAPHVGDRVEVVGSLAASASVPRGTSGTAESADEPANRAPILKVESVRTVATASPMCRR